MPYVRAFMAAAAVGVIGISGVASESAAASSQSPARPAEVRKVLEVGPNGQPSVVATFKLATTAGVRDESPEGKEAVSAGECLACLSEHSIQDFGGGVEVEGLSGSAVEEVGDVVEVGL